MRSWIRGGDGAAASADAAAVAVAAAAVAIGADSRRASEPAVRRRIGSGPAAGTWSWRSQRSPPGIAACTGGGSGYSACWSAGSGGLDFGLRAILFPMFRIIFEHSCAVIHRLCYWLSNLVLFNFHFMGKLYAF